MLMVFEIVLYIFMVSDHNVPLTLSYVFSRKGINKRGRSPPKSIPRAADRIVGSSKEAIISASM